MNVLVPTQGIKTIVAPSEGASQTITIHQSSVGVVIDKRLPDDEYCIITAFAAHAPDVIRRFPIGTFITKICKTSTCSKSPAEVKEMIVTAIADKSNPLTITLCSPSTDGSKTTVLGKRATTKVNSDFSNQQRPAKRPRKKMFNGPASAFNYFARERRQIPTFKAELDAIPAPDRPHRLSDWWKALPATGREPYIAQQNADKLRWTRDTQCYAVLHDVLNDVIGSKIPNPYAIGASNISSAKNTNSNPKQPLPHNPRSHSITFMRYTSLTTTSKEQLCNDVHRTGCIPVLHDILEEVVDMTTEKAPPENMYPVTEGLRYSAYIPTDGPLGFTLDYAYPPEFDHKWVPVICGINASGAAFGCGKGIVPDGIRIGDYLTHLGGVPIIGTNMQRIVQLIKAAPRPLVLTLCRTLKSTLQTLQQHVREYKADAQWRGRERVNALTQRQDLETKIATFEEANRRLRKAAKEKLIEFGQVKNNLKKMQAQLRKDNYGILKQINDDATAAVARPQLNQGLKHNLKVAEERIQELETKWNQKVDQERTNLNILPTKFRKMICKMMGSKLQVPVAAITNPQPLYEESVSFTVEGLTNSIFREIFGNVGRREKKFIILTVPQMEKVLKINLGMNSTITMKDNPDLQFHVQVKENELGNSVLLRYKKETQSLKISCIVETREMESGVASLGKQARFA